MCEMPPGQKSPQVLDLHRWFDWLAMGRPAHRAGWVCVRGGAEPS